MEIVNEKLNNTVEEDTKESANKDVEEKLCREVASEVNATAEESKTKLVNKKSDETEYKKQATVSFNEIPEKHLKEKKKKKTWYMSFLTEGLGSNKNKKDRRSENDDSIEEEDDTDEEDENSYGDDVSNSCGYQNTSEKANKTKTIMDAKSSVSGLELHGSTVFNFFMSLLPDVKRLNAKRQRKFKFNAMKLLYELLDEEDQELGISTKEGRACTPSDSVLFQKCKVPKPNEKSIRE